MLHPYLDPVYSLANPPFEWLLLWTRIYISSSWVLEQGSGPLDQDLCKSCSLKVYTGYLVSFCTVSILWCFHLCVGIRTEFDYLVSHHGAACSTPIRLSSPIHEFELIHIPALPHNRITVFTDPDQHYCFITLIWEKQRSAVYLQWHPTLSRRTAGLPSPPQGVGCISRKDESRREPYPQKIYRLFYHYERTPTQR